MQVTLEPIGGGPGMRTRPLAAGRNGPGVARLAETEDGEYILTETLVGGIGEITSITGFQGRQRILNRENEGGPTTRGSSSVAETLMNAD